MRTHCDYDSRVKIPWSQTEKPGLATLDYDFKIMPSRAGRRQTEMPGQHRVKRATPSKLVKMKFDRARRQQ